MTDQSEDVWAILYEDADKVPEVFVGAGAEEAARRRYVQASDNWNCHLLCRADAARQPSPSARDVALKCAEICKARANVPGAEGQDTQLADFELRYCAEQIRAYADTLGNESAAAQVPAQPDSGAPSEVLHLQPAHAADHAPEAAKKPPAFYSAPEVCHGCGKPLLRENAWMFDGCPCNSPAGVNDGNLYRWHLLSELQQQGVHRAAAAEQALARAQEERDHWHRMCKGVVDSLASAPSAKEGQQENEP